MSMTMRFCGLGTMKKRLQAKTSVSCRSQNAITANSLQSYLDSCARSFDRLGAIFA